MAKLTRVTESLITYKPNIAGSVSRLLEEKLSEVLSVGDLVTLKFDGSDESVALQSAIDKTPAGAILYFPEGVYVGNNITISKPITIIGASAFDTGTVFRCNHATLPFFKADGAGHVSIERFRCDTSVARAVNGRAYIEFKNSFRITLRDFMVWDYYLGIELDGCTEVLMDNFYGFTSNNLSQSGFCLLGRTKYTGPVYIDNCHVKGTATTSSGWPEFGFRAMWTDVLTFGPNVTVIQHSRGLEIIPAAGQISSLLRVFGIWDTGNIGIRIAPTGNGVVQALTITDAYAGANLVAGVVIDGTLGEVKDSSINGGDYINNTQYGINMQGNVNVTVKDTRIGNNGTGIRADNYARVFIDGNIIGDTGFGGNGTAIAMGATAMGRVCNNVFKGNTANGNIPAAVMHFNNEGFNDWIPFTPTCLPIGAGSFTMESTTGRYIRHPDYVLVEMEGKFGTVNTVGDGVTMSLPVPATTNDVMVGRENDQTGKMLQAFVSAGSVAAVRTYDNLSPAKTGARMLISGRYLA